MADVVKKHSISSELVQKMVDKAVAKAIKIVGAIGGERSAHGAERHGLRRAALALVSDAVPSGLTKD